MVQHISSHILTLLINYDVLSKKKKDLQICGRIVLLCTPFLTQTDQLVGSYSIPTSQILLVGQLAYKTLNITYCLKNPVGVNFHFGLWEGSFKKQ